MRLISCISNLELSLIFEKKMSLEKLFDPVSSDEEDNRDNEYELISGEARGGIALLFACLFLSQLVSAECL